MLGLMRKHAKSWFIKVLLGSIILVFIFFYGFSQRQRAAGEIASVDGVKLSNQDFRIEYERLLQSVRSQGMQLNDQQTRQLKQDAVNNLVDQVLLVEQAKKWKIAVSDAEIKDYLNSVPVFQSDGEFSYSRFRQFVKFRGQTEEMFVERLRKDLLMQKIENLVRDGAKAPDDEVETVYNLFNDKITLQYVKLDAASFAKSVAPTESEIESYFNEHKDKFTIPETVRVEYIKFVPEDYMDKVTVDENEIRSRYEGDLNRWKVAKQVKGRDILIRTTEKDDPNVRMKALQKAEEILNRLREDGDFAALANEFSQDPLTASQGGDLGWKKPGELPEDLDKALFEMVPGQISEKPVKSPEGFHILKVDEVRSESTQPLEEVKGTLEKEIKEEKARQMAADLARQAYMSVFQGTSFDEAAKDMDRTIVTPKPFSMDEQESGLSPEFKEAAFALDKENDFSDVIEEAGAFCVIHLKEIIPSRAANLDEAKDEVIASIKTEKGFQAAKEEAGKIIEDLKKNADKTLEQIAKDNGFDFVTSQPIGRLFYFGALPRDLVQKAFSLPDNEKLIPEAYEQGESMIVGEIKQRIPADPKGLEEQKNMFRSMLLREKRQTVYNDWLEMLRSKADIKLKQAYHDMML